MIKQKDRIFLETVAKKIYNQLNDATDLDTMLIEKSISNLIAEAIDQDEINGIVKLSKDAKTDMESLIGELEPLGFENTVDYMTNLVDSIPDNLDAASLVLRDDPKETAEEIGKIVAATQKSNAVRDSVTDAITKVLGALDKLEGIEDADKDQLLSSLAGTTGFPAEDDLRKGAENAYSVPAEEKGVFGKIASFFGFGKDLSSQKFADDFLGAKLGSLQGKRDAFAALQSGNQQDADSAAQLADETQKDIEALSKGDASALPQSSNSSGEQSDDKSEDTGKDGQPQSEKEETQTDQAAETETQAAAQAAADADLSPSQGTADIIDKWASAGKTLSRNVSKKQRSALGDTLSSVFDKTAQTLSKNVEKAVDSWRESQRVLQSPNVSDLQISILKKSLASFVSNVITTESAGKNRQKTKEAVIRKMKTFLFSEGAYDSQTINSMNNNTLFQEFVSAYCNAQMNGKNPKKVLKESRYKEGDMITYRLQKLAGLN